MVGYRFVPHTAEIALKVWGKTLDDLFLNAALGLVKAVGPKAKDKGTKKSIRLKFFAASVEELFVHWLNEIAFLIQHKRFLPAKWQCFVTPNGNAIKGKIVGKIYKELALTREVKSATYHNLKIQKIKSRFLTTVILDV